MAYNHKIALVRKVVSTGDGGRQIESLTVFAEPFAKMETKRHNPVTRADTIEFPTSVIFKIRYSKSYLGADHIVKNDKKYKILSTDNPDDRNRELIFWCREQ